MRKSSSMTDLSPGYVCAPFAPALIEAWHPARAEAEAFVAARFQSAFGACASSSYPTIAAHFDEHGRIVAAAGVRLAGNTPLFLERYLDEPVEQAVARAIGRPVVRDSIAEIGAFAALDLAAALTLFAGLAAWLEGPGRRRYAVATARPELERLLRRSGFDLRAVAEADPGRLGDAATLWGTYYAAGPRVFAGEIGVSPSLPELRSRLQAHCARRALRRAPGRRT